MSPRPRWPRPGPRLTARDQSWAVREDPDRTDVVAAPARSKVADLLVHEVTGYCASKVKALEAQHIEEDSREAFAIDLGGRESQICIRDGCSSQMKSGEAAFAYFFFDLANCIQDDGSPPIL